MFTKGRQSRPSSFYKEEKMNDFSKDEVLAILKFEAYKPAKSENKRKMHSEISRRVWLSDREWYSFKIVL